MVAKIVHPRPGNHFPSLGEAISWPGETIPPLGERISLSQPCPKLSRNQAMEPAENAFSVTACRPGPRHEIPRPGAAIPNLGAGRPRPGEAVARSGEMIPMPGETAPKQRNQVPNPGETVRANGESGNGTEAFRPRAGKGPVPYGADFPVCGFTGFRNPVTDEALPDWRRGRR